MKCQNSRLAAKRWLSTGLLIAALAALMGGSSVLALSAQNVALVEHGAAAERLKDQAMRLASVVSRFRLADAAH